MDRATKIYSLILGVISLSLAITFLYEPPKVKELNKQLEAIKKVKDFPYSFRVLRINNGIATMNSPISIDLPCGKVIAIIFPQLKGKSLLSAEYQQAQEQLAEVQMLASDKIKSDPQINKIVWELDKTWLIQNGVTFNNL